MKKLLVIVASAFIAQSVTNLALADDDFYGIVETRPVGTAGTWVVGGRTVTATEDTELDDDHETSFAAGTCVQVEMEDGLVEEIESESPSKCTK
jgi:hypothetical protein